MKARTSKLTQTMLMAVIIAGVMSMAACTSQPLRQDVLQTHVERNCRVEAATVKTYGISPKGDVDTVSSTYQTCMARKGF